MTLRPLFGRIRFTVAVEEAVEPVSVPATVVGFPLSGVSFTCTAVPDGRFVPFTNTCTGLGTEVGTTMSGGELNEPAGFAGAETPPTEAITSVGVFGRVTGLGCPKVCSLVEQRGTNWLKLKASTRMIPAEPTAILKLAGMLSTFKHGLPEIVFETNLIAPPEPLPPECAANLGPPSPLLA